MFGPFVSEYQMLSGAFAVDRFWSEMACLLLVFFGMGNTFANCSLGPTPENKNAIQFRDNFAIAAPVASCMLLTFALGVSTPPLLTKWGHGGLEFLQRTPEVGE